jgi:acyl dehydratase
MGRMKFADLYVGQVLTHGPASLTEEQILDFARQWDPQWFHTDPERAAAGHFQGLIASGWQTCALAMRMAVECLLHDSDALASPGVDHIRWLLPVRPNEPFTFRAEILEVRRSQKQPQLGVMRSSWALLQADGRPVMTLEASVLYRLE